MRDRGIFRKRPQDRPAPTGLVILQPGEQILRGPQPEPGNAYRIEVKLDADGDWKWNVYKGHDGISLKGGYEFNDDNVPTRAGHAKCVKRAKEAIDGLLEKEAILAEFGGTYVEWYGQTPESMHAHVERADEAVARALTHVEQLERRLLDAGQLPHVALTEDQLTA